MQWLYVGDNSPSSTTRSCLNSKRYRTSPQRNVHKRVNFAPFKRAADNSHPLSPSLFLHFKAPSLDQTSQRKARPDKTRQHKAKQDTRQATQNKTTNNTKQKSLLRELRMNIPGTQYTDNKECIHHRSIEYGKTGRAEAELVKRESLAKKNIPGIWL